MIKGSSIWSSSLTKWLKIEMSYSQKWKMTPSRWLITLSHWENSYWKQRKGLTLCTIELSNSRNLTLNCALNWLNRMVITRHSCSVPLMPRMKPENWPLWLRRERTLTIKSCLRSRLWQNGKGRLTPRRLKVMENLLRIWQTKSIPWR